MNQRQWNEGAPPHPGWWNTTVVFGNTRHSEIGAMWGWWDGGRWSAFAEPHYDAEQAGQRACQLGGINGSTEHVRWSHYWPENARVPRIDQRPEQAHA